MDKLTAIVDDNTIVHQGEPRQVAGLADAFPGAWAFQFTAEGGMMERRDNGLHEPAGTQTYDTLVEMWETQQPPPEAAATMEELRDQQKDAVQAALDREMQVVTDQYPRTEMQSWPQQEQEARELLVDSTADAPLVRDIAGTGDPLALAQTIVTKAAEFRALIGPAIRKRRALEVDIEAAYQAGDRAALEAISW